MSYIEGKIPSFSKAIISLWFRVPQESIDAVKEATGPSVNESALLSGILPLVVFGKRGMSDTPLAASSADVVVPGGYGPAATGLTGDVITIDDISPVTPGIAHVTLTHHINEGAGFTTVSTPDGKETVTNLVPGGNPHPVDPSYIGIHCIGPKPRLRINFESAKVPDVSGFNYTKTVTYDLVASGGSGIAFSQGTVTYSGLTAPFGLAVPFTDVTVTGEVHDVAWPGGEGPRRHESFSDQGNLGNERTGAIYSDPIEITPDHWHHLLVSVDFKTISTHGGSGGGSTASFTDSASFIYVALDDKNYIKFDLTSDWVDGGDDNAVITDGADAIAGAEPAKDSEGNVVGGTPSYTLSSPQVPGGLIGLPGTSETVDNIYRVEMAELQMWLNQSFDTGEVDNRRLFITDDGKPEKVKVAEDELGRPDVRLHGSGNWKSGRNTGSSNVTDDTFTTGRATEGDFTPHGGIEAWKPDPSLHGPQQHNQKN